METGRTVVLLNLENLYESLYDALNQYYVYFGGQRYVDLGLGTHKVKCRVHTDFRYVLQLNSHVTLLRLFLLMTNFKIFHALISHYTRIRQASTVFGLLLKKSPFYQHGTFNSCNQYVNSTSTTSIV